MPGERGPGAEVGTEVTKIFESFETDLEGLSPKDFLVAVKKTVLAYRKSIEEMGIVESGYDVKGEDGKMKSPKDVEAMARAAEQEMKAVLKALAKKLDVPAEELDLEDITI